ncbi:hypothetical protein CEK28_14770 [Xenophilus sp. AP218F]|nr:hypothetical protein CEK28_14770 [Xenophilus sp. AP218F]
MKTTLILAGVLAFSAAIGAHAATGVKQAGAAILIDGKVYYLPRPASVASPFALNARRGAGGQPAASALKRGDVLQPASQPESATATGLILAQLMPHAQSAAVARDHGLTVSFTMQNVVVFDTPTRADLLAVQKRLQADKRVKLVQIEMASNTNYAY